MEQNDGDLVTFNALIAGQSIEPKEEDIKPVEAPAKKDDWLTITNDILFDQIYFRGSL